MNKFIFSLLIIILFPNIGNCQDISHFVKTLNSSSNKREKLVALDSILSRTFTTNPKAFIDYSLQYIELAKSMDSIEAAARKAMNLQRPLTNYGSDPTLAIDIITNVLQKKEKIKDSLLLGGLYLKRGRARAKINLEKAIEDYTLAINNFSENDTLIKADAYLFRGQAFSSSGKFLEASESLKKAYSLYEAKQAYEYMVYAQQGIINMFSMNGFYDKAKKERELLIEKMESLQLHSYLAGEYYNQAIDYKKMGQRLKELEMLRTAENLYEKHPSNKSLFIGIQSMLITYYCESGQIDEAKKHLTFLDSVDYNFVGDIPSEINYISGKGAYLLAIRELEPALSLAQRRLELAKQIGMEDEIMEAHKLLADVYFALGDPYKSLESSKQANLLNDAIYNKSNVNALLYYQTLYETEKREKELIEKSANISLLEKDNEVFKKVLLFGGIAVLLFFGVLLLYRNQRHLKSTKLLQEKFSQELLAFQEEERMRISKDLHDGIGQQLLLIKNKLMLTGDEETKKMVNNTIEEVRSISRDLYPFQLHEMGITKAIEYTIDQIDENTTLFISASIEDIDNIFSMENEVNIFRIIQESLSNILKHAQAGASKVMVRKFPHSLIITIKDNGIGFDFEEKYQNPKSLGLKTLLERTKVLKGQMKVTSKKENGTLLEFEFPL